MTRINLVKTDRRPIASYEVEIVERKGLGHPDYIADSVSERVSVELSKYYEENFGVILHHNLDKTLVVGGQSSPAFGGGKVVQPIYIIVSGRATTEVREGGTVHKVPIGPIVLGSVTSWIKENFRFLVPERHVVVDYKIGSGSVDLVGVYELGARTGGVPLANDTSVGVGYAPLSPLERLVLEVEATLNSRDFKRRLPEVGEDIKVMGVRLGREVKIMVAAAMISQIVRDRDHYIQVKDEVKRSVEDLAAKLVPDYAVEVAVNTADKPEHGIFYLTVTGTSAEHGDDGMTGRGNRANGLITPMRPMSLEATAGKNPTSHIGKIYNVVARNIAERIHAQVKGVAEATVELVSQIGKPISEPLVVNVELAVEHGDITGEVRGEVEGLVAEELRRMPSITRAILEGGITLF